MTDSNPTNWWLSIAVGALGLVLLIALWRRR
jgi:hypothetical protein